MDNEDDPKLASQVRAIIGLLGRLSNAAEAILEKDTQVKINFPKQDPAKPPIVNVEGHHITTPAPTVNVNTSQGWRFKVIARDKDGNVDEWIATPNP